MHIPIPNIILRSSLFGILKKGIRKFERNKLKSTVNGYTVKYTGEQLDQSDLDVWLECISRYKNTALGCEVNFSTHDFLKSINRNTGKSDYNWLKNVFLRLRVNDVEISDGKYIYAGSLIFEQYINKKNRKNSIILNPKIVSCFKNSAWTGINKIVRMKLKGKPLTQWLYGFYSSHNRPLLIKVKTIKKLCGSKRQDIRKFKFDLKKCLLELSKKTKWVCSINKNNKILILK